MTFTNVTGRLLSSTEDMETVTFMQRRKKRKVNFDCQGSQKIHIEPCNNPKIDWGPEITDINQLKWAHYAKNRQENWGAIETESSGWTIYTAKLKYWCRLSSRSSMNEQFRTENFDKMIHVSGDQSLYTNIYQVNALQSNSDSKSRYGYTFAK